ncbi:MAG: serine/threonine-protein kinase [Gemmatimonadaceae bacterium]
MTDDFSQQLQAALGDGYLIERELGGAGMSRVFAAQEKSLQRRVVIKVLPPELAAGVNHDRFRREIQLAAQLQHPHIVPLLTAGEADGLLWFVMPFIEGESLRAAIARRGRFPARDVVRVLHDVTDALAYAHARGVVHRDIKPGNILTSGMHALVTDFGVAKALSAAIPSANGGTTTGMAIGTPAYMAPEQLAADPAADHRMDIYAVGLLGYELLTGKSPFAGASPQATLAAQLTQMPEAPSRSLPEVPVGLSNIIMQCLEKDANKRPSSATDLLAELDALQIGSGETPSRVVTRSRRGPLIAFAALALLAIAFVVAQKNMSPPDAAKTGKSGSKNAANPQSGAGASTIAAASDSASDSVARAAGTVGALARPETVVVYRDTSMNRDGAQRVALPIVLTRPESIQIANSFRDRQEAAASAPNRKVASGPDTHVGADGKIVVLKRPVAELAPIVRESLLVEMGRVFSDSIARVVAQMRALSRVSATTEALPQAARIAERFSPLIAPPTDGKPRLVVQGFENATGKRELGALGRTLSDSLRSALSTNNAISVVDEQTTMQAGRGGASFVTVGWSLRADFVVSGTYLLRGDSIALIAQFNDVRRGRFTRASESTAPISDPMRALAIAQTRMSAWIDSARTMRGGDRGGRGGPPVSPTVPDFPRKPPVE